MLARTNRPPRPIAARAPRLPLVVAAVLAAPLAMPLAAPRAAPRQAQAPQQAAPVETATPVELGQVDWQRDLDGALAQSKATGKPLAVLFQEVPG